MSIYNVSQALQIEKFLKTKKIYELKNQTAKGGRSWNKEVEWVWILSRVLSEYSGVRVVNRVAR